MDAFMEFEREMALKRRKDNPERFVPEKLLEYELSLQSQNQREKPKASAPKYDLSFYSSKNDEELSDARRYCAAPNNGWSVAFGTSYRPAYSRRPTGALVERMLVHLHVEDPDVVFAAEPLDGSEDDDQRKSPLQQQGYPQRPFAQAGTVRDALTWTFDLVSTPRPSLLRSLAAYASDENDIAALMAPQTAEAIQSERPHQHATIADIFDRFPSLRLSFAEFFQIAPSNAPRYYTVSSSRQFVPETVSITLGLRKTDALPLPRCSSYLAMLQPGDCIRASFYQSSFVFPFHDHRPIMLISAGTGIAPFRAFLQDLEHEDDTSPHQHRPAYLFYGCREKSVDFLYAEEFQRARDSGVLDQLHVEFSCDNGKPKRYVQDALLDQSELVARHLLADEGYIYVCGSLAMGRAVKKAIATALRRHPEYSDGAIATQQDAERIVAQKLAGQLIVTELW
ncbi:hypothetical protein PF004_g9766 [Phytophthora fragariae]|uniref:NADPH--hemoprotein reductase n=1 Tax=Phytophthora fragariae TaxID=53985 RepID=A0A6G0P310_9STRA|nr:hypothetical protein PF004_g9766 [Phytophthora fragariae]